MRTVVQWSFLALLGTAMTVTAPVWLTPPPAPGDSGDSGDSGLAGDTGAVTDTGDTSSATDTASDTDVDTGATPKSDSGAVDTSTGDTGEPDTAEPTRYSAAQRAGESGDFGCSSVQSGVIGLTWLVGLVVAAGRREQD